MPANFFDLSPTLRARVDKVATLTITDPQLAGQRDAVVQTDPGLTEPTLMIDTIHRLQRFYFASELGLLDHPQIIAALQDDKNFPTWHRYAALDVDEIVKDSLAGRLYRCHAPLGPVVLMLGDWARDIAEGILRRCLDHADVTDIWIDDRLFERRMLTCLDEAGAKHYAELLTARYSGAKRRIVARGDAPSYSYPDAPPEPAIDTAYRQHFLDRMNAGNIWLGQKFSLTILPTPEDAAKEGMSFAEYTQIFFAMCAIDMNKINEAHQVLLSSLDPAETLRITNSDGTDVTFGIKGMTFLNGEGDVNIPGTEIFSSPVRTAVNGTIVAKGNFALPFIPDNTIRDITLEFKDGRIIRYDAAEGLDQLRETIEKDEGSHYLGELAFGTNPALTRHVTNGLLVEKIGGSFHVAIGRAYANEQGAVIDNGNTSAIHWDITTMLRDRDGRIEVDGKVIMEGGKYVDPRLAYLNGD